MKHLSTPKLYYSIKEVGDLFDEEQHILRYWEREFGILSPAKNRAGNRVYTENDIRVLKVIKKLLRVDRMPLANVKEMLRHGIPKNLTSVADEVSAISKENQLEQNTIGGKTDIGNVDYVQVKRSDLHSVISLLNKVANTIESL